MTKKEAYERLELPEGADLQEVRRKFAEMYNDYRMHIDNAHTQQTRLSAERRLEELKEAYALLNESDGMDDSGNLPRTGQSGAFEESADAIGRGSDGKENGADIDHALAVFGLGKSFPRHRLAAICQQHIADLEAQLEAATLPGIKGAYEKEVANAQRAWETIADWLTSQDVEAAERPVEEASNAAAATGAQRTAQKTSPAEQVEREPIVGPEKKSSSVARIVAILIGLAVLTGGFWWWSQRAGASLADPIESLAVTNVSDTTGNNATNASAEGADSESSDMWGATGVHPEVPSSVAVPTPEASVNAKAIYQKAMKHVGDEDYSQAVKLFHQAAEQGDPSAKYWLGYAYSNGVGVSKNSATGNKWYKEALAELPALAAKGDADAQQRLGQMYHFGKTTKVDYEKAAKWYLKAAKQGLAVAQFYLGWLYADGNGVKQDYQEAVKWYRKSAEQGDETAQNSLALRYENGQGVEQNDQEAVRWYRKSADQGYAIAQANLAWMYENGRGVSKNYEEAARWYRKSADQGYARAQNSLGIRYDNGTGVNKDYGEAVKWFRKAADQGFAHAQANLGAAYHHGHGVAKNFDEAERLYIQAAEGGNKWACERLADLGGDIEKATQDYCKAKELYQKAIDICGDKFAYFKLGSLHYFADKCGGGGYAEAKRLWLIAFEKKGNLATSNLGFMYFGGFGVEKDYKTAEMYFLKSIEFGSKNGFPEYRLGQIYQNGGYGVEQNLEKSAEYFALAKERGYEP